MLTVYLGGSILSVLDVLVHLIVCRAIPGYKIKSGGIHKERRSI